MILIICTCLDITKLQALVSIKISELLASAHMSNSLSADVT